MQMKNLKMLLLILSCLAVLNSCKKEKEVDYEMYCKINGIDWGINNSLMSEAEAYAVESNDTNVSIRAYGKINNDNLPVSIVIQIPSFHGKGLYKIDSIEADADAVTKKIGNATYYETYLLDKSKPGYVMVSEFGKRVNGKFEFTLVNPDPDADPAEFKITEGEFSVKIQEPFIR
jgi:hypothetical protein